MAKVSAWRKRTKVGHLVLSLAQLGCMEVGDNLNVSGARGEMPSRQCKGYWGSILAALDDALPPPLQTRLPNGALYSRSQLLQCVTYQAEIAPQLVMKP